MGWPSKELRSGRSTEVGLTRGEIGLRLHLQKDMATAAQTAHEIPEKALFRIGEVSRLTETKTFVLRFWESEFPTLQPVKSPSGHRLYRREDIETVFQIKRLLYEEGFTIAGARKHLGEKQTTTGEPVAAEAVAATVAAEERGPTLQAVMRPDPATRINRKLLLELQEELRAVLTLLKDE
jgi:DNA-binding transcriptional MerR regulator